MEARETDKLFRDKLKSLESNPKADSWGKLEAMLDKQEVVPWYVRWRVAAIGLLLILSAVLMVLWNQSNEDFYEEVAESTVKASEADKTNNNIAPEIIEYVDLNEETPDKGQLEETIPTKKVDVPKLENNEKKQIHVPVIKQKSTPQLAEEKKSINENTEDIISQDQNLLAESNISDEKEQEKIEIVQVTKKKKRLPIRITYKRGNTPVQSESDEDFIARQKTDTTGGKLKEFFAQTREFQPGDLWADIREAKHNLFQKKENSKRNNVKNLNK